jgi:hypothetical protein
MCLVKINRIPKLYRTLDHVAAAILSDAAVDDYSVNPVIVAVRVNFLLHLKEASAFGRLLNLGDQIIEFPYRAFTAPSHKRLLRWNRPDECFESRYITAVRETFFALAWLECIVACAVKHGLGYEVDDMGPTAQAVVFRANVQTAA